MKPKVKEEAGILLWQHLREANLEYPSVKEYRFSDSRRWRFDFAILMNARIGIEIEGGAFTRGRHTRGVGFIKDMEKYNHAVLRGWRVLRFTPDQVLKGEAIAFIKKVLES